MAVRYEELLRPVRQSLGDEETAQRAIRATLETLAERIGKDEALHLVAALPPEAGPWLFTTGPAQRFDPADFVSRVARRENAPVEVAERHTAVVMTALGQALDDETYRHLTARLPRTFAPLLPKGEFAGGVSADSFVRKVADRAGLDPPQAQRVAEVVLETLARRIGGDAEDLMTFLPVALHPALRRGQETPDPDLAPEEFVVEVARRTGVAPDRVIRYIRAVLSTVRDAVDDEEFFDVRAQLPGRYVELLREP
jgi:uncharacterized protein (DUF2267 family)